MRSSDSDLQVAVYQFCVLVVGVDGERVLIVWLEYTSALHIICSQDIVYRRSNKSNSKLP